MTLLTTVFAAVISTVVWYVSSAARKLKVGVLCLLYWGASLMWLVDAVVEYIEIRAEYFTPAPSAMLGDLYLGLTVTALGLIIWLVILLIRDPMGIVRSAIFEKKN